jgi:hypothetical protein
MKQDTYYVKSPDGKVYSFGPNGAGLQQSHLKNINFNFIDKLQPLISSETAGASANHAFLANIRDMAHASANHASANHAIG